MRHTNEIGRMVGAWLKAGSNVVQMIGNFVSMPDSGTEDEGADNLSGGGTGAYRTSALKDWWDGTTNRVNPLYAASDRQSGADREGSLQGCV